MDFSNIIFKIFAFLFFINIIYWAIGAYKMVKHGKESPVTKKYLKKYFIVLVSCFVIFLGSFAIAFISLHEGPGSFSVIDQASDYLEAKYGDAGDTWSYTIYGHEFTKEDKSCGYYIVLYKHGSIKGKLKAKYCNYYENKTFTFEETKDGT